jgi:hypothetical protein
VSVSAAIVAAAIAMNCLDIKLPSGPRAENV